MLTPIESLLLNKQMPVGFKLELEEILQKEAEEKTKPPVHKRHKKGFTFSSDYQRKPSKVHKGEDYLNVNDNILTANNALMNGNNSSNMTNHSNIYTEKKSLRQPKPLIREDLGYIDKDVIKSKSNPMRAAVAKQCEKGFMKLKMNPIADYFYFSKKPNEPCLNQIEKNIKNYKYKSIYELIMDLRKIWNYYFSAYPSDKDVYARTCEMSRYSEEIYKEIEILFEDKNEISEINRKIDMLTKEFRDIKESHVPSNIQYPPKKIPEKYTTERPMTANEKATLRNNIGLLKAEQVRGIVRIVADTMNLKNKKYLEFDIDTLSTKKLRELDHYVKNCLRKNKKHQTKENNPIQKKEINDIERLKNDLGNNIQKCNVNNDNMNKLPNTIEDKSKENKIEDNKMDEDSSSDSESSSLSSL